MPELYDTQTGKRLQVASGDEAAQAFTAGRAGFKPGQRLHVVSADGEMGTIDASEAAQALESGMRIASDVDVEKARLQAEHGTGLETVKAGAEGLARGATFGLSDVALTETGLAEGADLRARQEANPLVSGGAELAGAIAPMLLSGGASSAATGAGLAARAGQVARTAGAIPRGTAALGRAVEAGAAKLLGSRAGTLAGRGASLAAGGAVEGAVIGAGQAVSAAALDDVELTAEQLLASAGHGALLGGVAGGALGAGAKVVADTGRAVARRLPDTAKKLFTREGAAEVLEQYADRQAFAVGKNPSGGKGFVREAIKKKGGIERGGRIAREDYNIGPTTTVDDIAKLAPARKREAGEQVGAALRRMDEVAEPAALPQAARIDDRIRKEVLGPLEQSKSPALRKMADRVGAEVGAQGFLQSADDAADRAWSLESLHTQRRVLDDLAYKENLSGTMGKPTAFGEELIKVRRIVENEIEAAAERVGKSAGEDIAGAYRDAKERYGWHSLFERMSRDAVNANDANDAIGLLGSQFGNMMALGEAAVTGSIGLETLVIPWIAGRAHKLVRQHLPGVAVAAATQLRAAQQVTERALNVERQMDRAVVGFFARAREGAKRDVPIVAAQLKPRRERYEEAKAELVAATPEKLVERATAQMGRSSHEALATAYTASAQRGADFLRAKRPAERPVAMVRPDLDKTQKVSDHEMARFLRYVDAVKDPMSVVAGIESGEVTIEGVEALQAVYPRMYEALVTRVTDAISQTDKQLPYSDLRRLSIVLDTPLHPSLTPEFIAFAQSRYASPAPVVGQAQSQAQAEPSLSPSQRSAPELAQNHMTGTQQAESRRA